MIKNTPPMGWNSWNTFGENISEQLIFETADKMVEEGLLDLGYEYLVIDDCWAEKERDENGRLVPDHTKFPNGMKAVADYVHSKGLKFGMYSCVGNLTCGKYPGSFEHEFVDAETFAEWGVDFLKYDYCFHSDIIHGKYLYRRMGLALKNCGRDILFSACSWGSDNTAEWIRETGANMWRSTVDIFDTSESFKKITEQQNCILPYGGMGCFNDMDMLVVGMNGNGNVGLGGMSELEYKTHFSIWALMGSPLMIGCDIRNMDETTRKILSNKDLIAINQDADCRQLIKLEMNWPWVYPELQAYARMLENGDIAVGFFNTAPEVHMKFFLGLEQLGLPESTGQTLEMHELWTGETVICKSGTAMFELEPNDCKVYRCKVVDA